MAKLRNGRSHVEVVNVDAFEARRQTFKRNQHGEHDPVLLGRMFWQMREDRDLSQRGLAKGIDVSEGTIRNALLYAEAADLRNSYAPDSDDAETVTEISEHSIRQLRVYCALPHKLRDCWLRDGADLKLLHDIGSNIPVLGKRGSGVPAKMEVEPASWSELVDLGLAGALEQYQFRYARALWGLWAWHDAYGHRIRSAKAYLAPVAANGLTHRVLDEALPVREVAEELVVPLSPEKWAALVSDASQRMKGTAIDEVVPIIAAAVRVTLREQGEDLDYTDPRVAETKQIVDQAPDYIRDADLDLWDRLNVLEFDADLPSEILEKVKRAAIEKLVFRDKVISGETGVPEDHPLSKDWAEMTALEAIGIVWDEIGREQRLLDRDDLFADRDNLMAAVMAKMNEAYTIREEKIDDQPAHEVLGKRLAGLAWPEFRLLAAYILGEQVAAGAFWRRAFEDEPERPEGAP